VLIVVDLRRTSEKALQRYMGRANLVRFRAFHSDALPTTRDAFGK
jgi:hypothetical protein